MVIIRDVTECKRAESVVLETQAELARIVRGLTVGELTASIAHELNQPLGAIANNGAACLRLFDETAGAPAEAREALSDIIADARRASAIIGRVRKLSNKSSSEKTRVRLQDVIGGVLALAQRELAERSITVQVRLAEHLPSVAGDNLQLQQLTLNLVVNAIDAMDRIEERRRVLKIDGRRDELAGAPADAEFMKYLADRPLPIVIYHGSDYVTSYTVHDGRSSQG